LAKEGGELKMGKWEIWYMGAGLTIIILFLWHISDKLRDISDILGGIHRMMWKDRNGE